jgi:hypothetical protein
VPKANDSNTSSEVQIPSVLDMLDVVSLTSRRHERGPSRGPVLRWRSYRLVLGLAIVYLSVSGYISQLIGRSSKAHAVTYIYISFLRSLGGFVDVKADLA